MSETNVFAVGDTLTIYICPIVDGNGKAVPLTGGSARLYAKGRTNADRPATAANVVLASCSFTAGSKVVTTAVTTGLVVGMRVIHAQAHQGAWITSISAGVSFTMNQPAIGSQASQSVTFWHGVVLDVTGDFGDLGLPQIVGIGAFLSPGVVVGNDEIYDDEVAYVTAGGLYGVSSRSTFIGRRPL